MSSPQHQRPQHYPMSRRLQQTTSAYDADTMADEDSDDVEETGPFTVARTPRSAIRYQSTPRQQPETRRTRDIPARASAPTRQQPPHTHPPRPNRGLVPMATPEEPPTHSSRRRRWHPLFFIGLGLFIMVLGYLLFGAVSSWWQSTLDGWHYGYPRTYQTDAVVGHHDSTTNPSHFIAINLHSHIEVIEFPGGDVTHARIYLGPTLIGSGEDLAPVTLSFKDVNGDGKPDLIVSVGGTIAVFINDAGQFRPLKPGEQVTL